MLIVPLQAVPSQTVQAALGGQNCTLNVYQKNTGLYIDVLVDNVGIIYGVICLNLNLIVRSEYLGFIGDLMFIDNQMTSPGEGTDPTYLGLGAQFSLAYLAPGDLPPDLGVGVS